MRKFKQLECLDIPEYSESGVEIQTDGRTVWVNLFCESIGRFGPRGIDIHNSVEDQMNGKPQCLFCTHGLTTDKEWNLFVEKMNEFFSIEIPHELNPFS